jgi:hypothetical protein
MNPTLPNQALETTTRAGAKRADARFGPVAVVVHLKRWRSNPHART